MNAREIRIAEARAHLNACLQTFLDARIDSGSELQDAARAEVEAARAVFEDATAPTFPDPNDPTTWERGCDHSPKVPGFWAMLTTDIEERGGESMLTLWRTRAEGVAAYEADLRDVARVDEAGGAVHEDCSAMSRAALMAYYGVVRRDDHVGGSVEWHDGIEWTTLSWVPLSSLA